MKAVHDFPIAKPRAIKYIYMINFTISTNFSKPLDFIMYIL